MKSNNNLPINFETKLFKIKDWTILHLPVEVSMRLPTRGMLMIEGNINDIPFKALLEPDGRYAPDQNIASHWFNPDKKLLKEASAASGDIVRVSIKPTKEWIEPDISEDIKNALNSSVKALVLWNDISPLARWDWIRWIRAVKTPETRQKHLEIMLDKLNKGMRRPCCFNRNLCSEPYVSRNWVLLEPTDN